MGKQDDELIAAIAKGIVNQPQVRLDHVSDFCQQLAAHQMAVGVIDVLEMIEIDEDHAEFVFEAGRAIDFRLQRLVQVPRIVEAGAVIGDGQLLDLLDGAGVVDGDGGIIAERLQKEHFGVAEIIEHAIDQLDDAQGAVLGAQRYAHYRAGLPLGHFINTLGKSWIGVNVGDNQRFPVLRYPTGNALAHPQAHRL